MIAEDNGIHPVFDEVMVLVEHVNQSSQRGTVPVIPGRIVPDEGETLTITIIEPDPAEEDGSEECDHGEADVPDEDQQRQHGWGMMVRTRRCGLG